jgi:hypothetical protein
VEPIAAGICPHLIRLVVFVEAPLPDISGQVLDAVRGLTLGIDTDGRRLVQVPGAVLPLRLIDVGEAGPIFVAPRIGQTLLAACRLLPFELGRQAHSALGESRTKRKPAGEGDGLVPIHIGAGTVWLLPPGCLRLWFLQILPPAILPVATVVDEGLELDVGDRILGDPEGRQLAPLAALVDEGSSRNLDPGDVGDADAAGIGAGSFSFLSDVGHLCLLQECRSVLGSRQSPPYLPLFCQGAASKEVAPCSQRLAGYIQAPDWCALTVDKPRPRRSCPGRRGHRFRPSCP